MTLEAATLSARDRLLAAGGQLLGGITQATVERFLTANEVSRTAGLSRRTFYDNFATMTDFVQALTDMVKTEAAHDARTDLDALDSTEGDIRLALAVLTDDGRQARVSQRATVVLKVLSSPSDHSLGTPVRWRQLVGSLADIGQVPRDTLTQDDVAAALAAVADAFGVAPIGVRQAVVTDALLGVISSMTVSRGHDGEQSDLALMETRIATTWREMANSQPVLNIRRVVLQAASAEIAANGLSGLDLSVLRRRTGLSESAIGRYVGSVRDIASALLEDVYPGLALALEEDPNFERRPAAALHAHVCRMVEIVRDRPDFAEVELASRLAPHGQRKTIGRSVGVLDNLLLDVLSRLSPQTTATELRPLVGVVQQLSCALARDTTFLAPQECGRMVLAMIESQFG